MVVGTQLINEGLAWDETKANQVRGVESIAGSKALAWEVYFTTYICTHPAQSLIVFFIERQVIGGSDSPGKARIQRSLTC